jgi:hypothetical protein
MSKATVKLKATPDITRTSDLKRRKPEIRIFRLFPDRPNGCQSYILVFDKNKLERLSAAVNFSLD